MKENMLQDQASGLRRLTKPSLTKVIAVTGGKGGVGKTNVTLGLAISMARQGKKVLVLDADLGLANVDVMLGIRARRNLGHVLAGECTLQEAIVEGPHGIRVIPATSGTQSMTELTPQQHAGLIRAFGSLEEDMDVLLIDTAAGISDMVVSFARAAQDVVVVVCDEPTSITDAYALIKLLSREHHVQRFKVVANMVRSYREGRELFAKLTLVTERFLNVTLELVACVPLDDKVRQSVKRQKIVVDAYPRSPAALAISSLANKALTWPIPKAPSGHLEFFVERLLNNREIVGESYVE
jgi:flagellar biosynthesis protein FlhG